MKGYLLLKKSKVIFASKNKDKHREIAMMLRETPVDLIFGPEVEPVDVQERGKSYSENALLKALAWSRTFNMPALADDSGLEVMALNNWPGIYSARIASDDESRIGLVLDRLKGIKERDARFVASVALVLPKMSQVWLTEGMCYGKITETKRGYNGFGYDPIFMPCDYDKTFAEMEPEEKNALSHRHIAIKALCDMLKSQNVIE